MYGENANGVFIVLVHVLNKFLLLRTSYISLMFKMFTYLCNLFQKEILFVM